MASININTYNPATAPLPPLPEDLVLPPLPTINNEAIERLAFTHSSHAKQGKSGIFDMGEVRDNEKLEHVGDSLLSE